MELIIIGVLVLVLILVLVTNIRIVQQAKAVVVERLGAYKATWGVGLHFKIPFIERVAKKLTLMEQVSDFLVSQAFSTDLTTHSKP